MEYDEAREIHKGDVIFCYNLKEHPDVQRCKVLQYPLSENRYYPDDKRFWNYSKILLKPMDSKGKEFVSHIKHLYWTEETANKHLLQHLNNNIGIYQREIDIINKEAKRKLAPFKKRLAETKRLLKKVIKNKGNSIKST